MKDYNYQLLNVMSSRMLLLDGDFGQQIWTMCICRKAKTCVITGEGLKGKIAFRPVTHKNNRMHRISPQGIHVIAET